jgi:hypothetical protein
MNVEQSAIIAKIATGQWSKEYTTELGTGYYMALENYTYDQAFAALKILLREKNRRFAPTGAEIAEQIESGGEKMRQYQLCLASCKTWQRDSTTEFYEMPVWDDKKQTWHPRQYVRAAKRSNPDMIICEYRRKDGTACRHVASRSDCVRWDGQIMPKIEFCLMMIEAETIEATRQFGRGSLVQAIALANQPDGASIWADMLEALVVRAFEVARSQQQEAA